MYDYKYPVYILEWLPSYMKAGWFSFNNDDYNVDDDIKSDDSARAQNEVDPLFHLRTL